jgi:hypothetical protein
LRISTTSSSQSSPTTWSGRRGGQLYDNPIKVFSRKQTIVIVFAVSCAAAIPFNPKYTMSTCIGLPSYNVAHVM